MKHQSCSVLVFLFLIDQHSWRDPILLKHRCHRRNSQIHKFEIQTWSYMIHLSSFKHWAFRFKVAIRILHFSLFLSFWRPHHRPYEWVGNCQTECKNMSLDSWCIWSPCYRSRFFNLDLHWFQISIVNCKMSGLFEGCVLHAPELHNSERPYSRTNVMETPNAPRKCFWHLF